MIPATARKLIEDWRLGFVATTGADGAPNVSPKGTFVVLDETTIAFAEMRSPQTVRNIAANPGMEVNFVDMLGRKGVRLRGTARFVARGEAGFDALYPAFAPMWGDDLGAMFNGIVVMTVSACRPLQSPAYEAGADERALRDHWMERIAGLHAATGRDPA